MKTTLFIFLRGILSAFSCCQSISRSSRYAFLLLVVLLSGCANHPKQPDSDVKLLTIDWKHISDAMDYSFMVEDSVLMIPLETTDECLIGEVTKLIYQNDLIYIADNTSQSVFVFDKFGKLKTKIHVVGNGPGEYTEINYFTVHGTDMVVYDINIRKLLFYDASGKFIYDKDVSDIWGTDLFCIGDILYLPNDGSSSKSGFYNLFTIDLSHSDKIEKYLPFEDSQNDQGWSIDSYYALLGNEALLCFCPFDELYTVKDGEVSLSYKVDFGDRRLPKQYIEGDGTTALRTAIRDNYVTGIDRVRQSKKYVFLQFGDSENDYVTIYNKETGEIQTTKDLSNAKMGDLLLQANGESFIIQNERIIQCYNADYWNYPGAMERVESSHFYTEELKQKFLKLTQTDESESNPIILIQKLKQ